MATKFICPACWHSRDFADDWAGKTVKCPECHARGPVTLVPGIVTTYQETTDVMVAASAEPPQSQPTHSGGREIARRLLQAGVGLAAERGTADAVLHNHRNGTNSVIKKRKVRRAANSSGT
jgi:hypothetical protein